MTFNGYDVWERLKNTEKPIVIYGTGNGADKILDELARRNISVCGVFASDGFVRKRQFRGFDVLSYAEARECFGEFFTVIAFASSLPDVMENMLRIAGETETVAPEVPLYGGEVCDEGWFAKYNSELDSVMELLEDELSKNVFRSVLNYRYSGSISYLTDYTTCDNGLMELIGAKNIGHYCDLGAYNGDTLKRLLTFSPQAKAVAFEPDAKSFTKLANAFEGCGNVTAYNLAAWNEKAELEISTGGSRGSSVNRGGKTVTIQANSLDEVLDGEKTDYIKYDVEGCEWEDLAGSEKTISRFMPTLSVSLYHRTEDIFRIPLCLNKKYPGYRFYMRRPPYIPAWDLELICLSRGK